MTMTSTEDFNRRKAHLRGILRGLEDTVANETWDSSDPTMPEPCFRAVSRRQTVKYAKKLIKESELFDEDLPPDITKWYQGVRKRLEEIDTFLEDVEKRTTPPPKKLQTILSTLPIPPELSNKPSTPTPQIQLNDNASGSTPGGSGGGLEDIKVPDSSLLTPTLPSAENLLLTPSDRAVFSSQQSSFLSPTSASTLIPPSLPSSPSLSNATATAATSALPTRSASTSNARLRNTNANSTLSTQDRDQTSKALHTELSNQLAQMATQLKLNTQHFSASLAKDRTVIEESGTKLEENYDVMKTQRVRLRDHRGKSSGTTWLVFLAIVAVLVVFMVMVSVIRFTRR